MPFKVYVILERALVVRIATSPEVCVKRSPVFAEPSTSQCCQGAQPQLVHWVADCGRWWIARRTRRVLDDKRETGGVDAVSPESRLDAHPARLLPSSRGARPFAPGNFQGGVR